MSKTKIYVKDVIEPDGIYDVVFAEINDGISQRSLQICMPKYCNMPSLVGKEIFYEVKDGVVRVTPVKRNKKQAVTLDDSSCFQM